MGLKTPPDKRAFYTALCAHYVKDNEVIQYDRNVQLVPMPQPNRTRKVTGSEVQILDIVHTAPGMC